MPEESDRTLLARIDERTLGIKDALEKHIIEDTRRFEEVFARINHCFEKFEEKFSNKIDGVESSLNVKIDKLTTEKVAILWDVHNKKDGAVGMGKLAIGAVGGLLGAAATLISLMPSSHIPARGASYDRDNTMQQGETHEKNPQKPQS